jgi:uncharacterized repeat protein (TIGR02543 family)
MKKFLSTLLALVLVLSAGVASTVHASTYEFNFEGILTENEYFEFMRFWEGDPGYVEQDGRQLAKAFTTTLNGFDRYNTTGWVGYVDGMIAAAGGIDAFKTAWTAVLTQERFEAFVALVQSQVATIKTIGAVDAQLHVFFAAMEEKIKETNPSADTPVRPNPQYTVIFDPNGGNFGTPEATLYMISRPVPPAAQLGDLPSHAIRAGFHFVGWNTKEDGTGAIAKATDDIVGNITYYAQWRATSSGDVKFIVTFNPNGGRLANEADKTIEVVSGAAITTLPTAPVRDNYTFIGWNTRADGKGDSVTKDTNITGPITVYAQWKQDSKSPQDSLQKWLARLPSWLKGVKNLPVFLQQIIRYVFFGWIFDVIDLRK